MTRMTVAFMVLVLTAALMACGAHPATSRSDVNNPADAAMVDTDRPAPPNPDVVMTSDTPPPPRDVPSVDVPATPSDTPPNMDIPSTPTDAGSPNDATEAAVDSGSIAFDANICARLRSRRWRVRDTAGTGDFIRCEMNGDGSAHITIGTSFAITMQSGYDEGRCMNRTCTLPEEGALDGCVWDGMSVDMQSFQATCNGRSMHIEAVP